MGRRSARSDRPSAAVRPAARPPRSAVEIGGGLVEEQQRARPAGTPGRGPPAGAPRRTGRPRRSRAGSQIPSGSRATTSSRPASLMAARTSSSLASGRPSRTLSAMERANRCGRCGTQASWARQASGSRSARSMSPIRTEPSRAGVRPSRTPSSVDLPQPLGPAIATTSPGSTVRDTSRQRRQRAGPGSGPRAGRSATSEVDGSGTSRRVPRRRQRSLEHLEDVLGRLHPFGAGVVVRRRAGAAGGRPRGPG